MNGGRFLVTAVSLSLFVAACGPVAGRGGSHAQSRPTKAACPDPQTAIALSVAADRIYLIDPATGSRCTVVKGLVDRGAGYAVWSPDHRHLAYGNHGIIVLDTKTGHTKILVPDRSASMPAWSPNGKQIAYGDGTHLWIVRASGGPGREPTKLRTPLSLAPLAPDWAPAPDIALDGLRLQCTSDNGCTSTRSSDVWTLSPAGSRLTRVTRAGFILNPKWSPDGSRILFIRDVGGGEDSANGTEIWVVGKGGSNPRPVLEASDILAADWSPGGDRIVLVRGSTSQPQLTVWVADADGSGLRQLGEPLPGTLAEVDW